MRETNYIDWSMKKSTHLGLSLTGELAGGAGGVVGGRLRAWIVDSTCPTLNNLSHSKRSLLWDSGSLCNQVLLLHESPGHCGPRRGKTKEKTAVRRCWVSSYCRWLFPQLPTFSVIWPENHRQYTAGLQRKTPWGLHVLGDTSISLAKLDLISRGKFQRSYPWDTGQFHGLCKEDARKEEGPQRTWQAWAGTGERSEGVGGQVWGRTLPYPHILPVIELEWISNSGWMQWKCSRGSTHSGHHDDENASLASVGPAARVLRKEPYWAAHPSPLSTLGSSYKSRLHIASLLI